MDGRKVVFGLAVLVGGVVTGCSSGHKLPLESYAVAAGPVVPDYSNLYYWAAHPAKWDPSDSLPKPYRNEVKPDSADVFFVHPTSYLDDKPVRNLPPDPAVPNSAWNADINDAAINQETDYSSVLYQGSAFNGCRVFAPRYRQAHINLFFVRDSLAKPFFDTAYTDVRMAFMYYLVHENKGRPFIIASHSQGTVHAARLIQEFIEHKPLEKQLVAAYLLGMPIKQGLFEHCQPCTYAAQTNCFVSWRTFKTGHISSYVMLEKYKTWVVNPLTWTMDDLPADRHLNTGAVLFNFNKPRRYNVSTRIHGNVLWSTKPRFLGNLFFNQTNYHIGDVNLFWRNIRDNVQTRVRAWYRQQPGGK